MRDSGALEFTYAWPVEAAREAVIDSRFRKDAQRAYLRALHLGRENQRLYRKLKREGVRDFYSMH